MPPEKKLSQTTKCTRVGTSRSRFSIITWIITTLLFASVRNVRRGIIARKTPKIYLKERNV